MHKINILVDERLLTKNFAISVYERYISFDKHLSDIIFQNDINSVDFAEQKDSIIFFHGHMFDIRPKGKNAVIYSKSLADLFRKRLSLPEFDGVQKVYVSFNSEYFIIPTSSNNFLQKSCFSHNI